MSDRHSFLEMDRLLVHRGQKLVVDVPRLEMEPGEVLAVAGPNGAGKSTLLLAIAGLIKLSQGEIHINQISTRDSPLLARKHCALVLQEPLLLHTSVHENIGIGLRFRGMDRIPSTEVWITGWKCSGSRTSPGVRHSGFPVEKRSV